MSFATSGISPGRIVHVLFDCSAWAAPPALLVRVIQAVQKTNSVFSPDSPKQMDPKRNKEIGQV